MSATFECPNCKEQLPVPEGREENFVMCPACWNRVAVPELPPPMPAIPLATGQGSETTSKAPATNTAAVVWCVLGCLALLIWLLGWTTFIAIVLRIVVGLAVLAAIGLGVAILGTSKKDDKVGFGVIAGICAVIAVVAWNYIPSHITQSPLPLPKTDVSLPPVEVRPAPNIDERLFLTRSLERMYYGLPAPSADGQQFTEKVVNFRHNVNRHYLYLKDKSLDPKLMSLYGELLNLTDSYTSLLVEVGAIRAGAVARSESEATESTFTAGVLGGATMRQMTDQGASGGEALIAGAGMALLAYVLDQQQKMAALDLAQKQAMETAVHRWENRRSEWLASAQNAAIELTEKYGWDKGAAGFNPRQESTEYVRTLRGQSRDPFAAVALCNLRSRDQTSPGDKLAAAHQCVEAASWVPAGQFYDEYRLEVLYAAANLANIAVGIEVGGTRWVEAKNANADWAVQVWDACLRYDSGDATGELREQKAWALLVSGHACEAYDLAISVRPMRKGTLRYAYDMAVISSETGRTEEAIGWLEYAIRGLHYTGISWVKKDPNLTSVRERHKERFAEITTVKVAWRIDWGLFVDDVVLVNQSPFPLTNVVLTPTVKSMGHTDWGPWSFQANRVEPGEVRKWNTRISSRGSDFKLTGTLSCDQNK